MFDYFYKKENFIGIPIYFQKNLSYTPYILICHRLFSKEPVYNGLKDL